MDVQKEIYQMIAEQLNLKIEDIQPESEFIKDLKADSLDVVELVMSAEEKFNIQIPDEEAENLISVKAFIDYIKSNQS